MLNETPSAQRKLERLPVHIPVTLLIGGTAAKCPASSVDLTPEGMRLRTDAVLAPDQCVRILLPAYPDHYLRARVTWVGDGASPEAGQAGFQFLNPDTGLAD
jgi:PilZ domain